MVSSPEPRGCLEPALTIAPVLIGVLLALLLFVGCTPREVVRYEIVEVAVPVPVPPPEPPSTWRPVLPIEDLHHDATPDQVARAYVATTLLLIDYARQLEHIVNSYRRNDL